MFETKSELRSIATRAAAIAVAITTSIALTGCAPQQTEEQKKILNFIDTKFVDDSYVEGFTPGQADYGITWEMLLQRKALLDNSESFKKAVAASLEDPTITGTVDSATGILFAQGITPASKAIQEDIAGKFAFVSAAVHANNEKLRGDAIDLAAAKFKLSDKPYTDFSIAWLVLGLDSNHREDKATEVAQKLVAGQDADGGFDDFTPDASTTDATGLALMALASVHGQGTSEQNTAVDAAIQKALGYLTSTIKKDHWEAYDAVNTNGTAYAYMGIKSAIGDTDLLTTIQDWLATQVMPDGGIQAGFAPGKGDTMATSQVAAAIFGKTYLELLN